jgi:hypothetical protein
METPGERLRANTSGQLEYDQLKGNKDCDVDFRSTASTAETQPNEPSKHGRIILLGLTQHATPSSRSPNGTSLMLSRPHAKSSALPASQKLSAYACLSSNFDFNKTLAPPGTMMIVISPDSDGWRPRRGTPIPRKRYRYHRAIPGTGIGPLTVDWFPFSAKVTADEYHHELQPTYHASSDDRLRSTLTYGSTVTSAASVLES